jgi:quinol monooxygenase YgiN
VIAVTGRIVTAVSARVDAVRADELVEGFRRLVEGPTPVGLLRSELLRGPDERWVVQTLWRDRQALDAMRATAEVPAALQLFIDVGVQPTLEIFEVAADVGL